MKGWMVRMPSTLRALKGWMRRMTNARSALVATITLLVMLPPSLGWAGTPYSVIWVFKEEEPVCVPAGSSSLICSVSFIPGIVLTG